MYLTYANWSGDRSRTGFSLGFDQTADIKYVTGNQRWIFKELNVKPWDWITVMTVNEPIEVETLW